MKFVQSLEDIYLLAIKFRCVRPRDVSSALLQPSAGEARRSAELANFNGSVCKPGGSVRLRSRFVIIVCVR
eukprot:2605432-Amphidinium_carterae.1